MTRVLYVEANEDGTVGGSHKILHDLVTRLSPDFHPVVLFYEDNIWGRRLTRKGVEVVAWDEVRAQERHGLKSGGKLSTLLALFGAVRRRWRFLRDQKIDLVHLNNSPFIGYDDWLPAARLAGVPCVVYGMGDLQYEPNPMRRLGLRSFDAYFPLSVLVRDAFERNGVPRERMDLAYPGVDMAELDGRTYRPSEETRAEFGLSGEQLLVVMVGNIRRWKGQDVVVEALSGLDPAERARLRVLFVGQGGDEHSDFEAELRTAIQKHGLDEMVRFTGRREDVPDLLEAADIAIHASVSPEPFGLVVQEAMFHGCATVAADEGGPVEMMTPESGRMFDTDRPEQLTAHLKALIDSAELRERLGVAARAQARTFAIQRHVDIVEERYRRVLS